MLTRPDERSEQVTTAHRAKLAYVYVRQSSAGQVRQHQESTELQYRLVDRASSLGWPRERITVIDDDLGKSGASSAARQGFQRLIAEIGLGKAGLVLSLDASRLARNNRDWHQLLELCSIFGVLLADGERLYDPGAHHDRLLLGLSGLMSEAVPSQRLLEIESSASDAMTVLAQAARSIMLLAGGWPRVCQPSTLRMLIWPEASRAQNSMAAVSAEGSTVCVLMRRLNSSCRRSIAFVVRADFHWLEGKRVKANSASPASSKLSATARYFSRHLRRNAFRRVSISFTVSA